MPGCRLGRVNQRPGSKSYRQEDTGMDTVAGMASWNQLHTSVVMGGHCDLIIATSNWWNMAYLNKLGFLGHFQNVYISH